MNFEIEFRAVGEGSKAGDCILVRYGDPIEVMVIDGGTRDSGAALVEHLRQLCGSNVVVAHALVTHADRDHASGLRDLLENIPVLNLWMHVPWLHAAQVRPYFKDKRFTDAGLAERLRKDYDILDELWKLADAQGTPIREPFRDAIVGPFRVLSPTEYSYVRLLPQFSRTPEAADEQTLMAESFLLPAKKQTGSILKALMEKVTTWADERWNHELLRDDGDTTASNESSTVLYGDFGNGRQVLLTGDAGNNALRWSADHAERLVLPIQNFRFVQVPHHGSRSNVGPTILNRLIGPIKADGQRTTVAYISAPKDDETHPRKMVVNAFNRRCANVYATQGSHLIHRCGFPKRDRSVDATPLEFFERVEDYDD